MRRLLSCLLLAVAVIAGAPRAHASRDIVQFGSSIHIPADQSVHDTVCFFCNVDAQGTIDGDVVVFFGRIHIAHHANHDVVNFFGDITADSNASIGHDMVSIFGSVRLGENVSVGKDLVAMFGNTRLASSVSVGGDRVIQPGWIFWAPLLIVFLVLILVVREIRAHRRRTYFGQFPFPPR